MVRTYQCAQKVLGCKNCSCGNHRGCKRKDQPTFNGVNLPCRYKYGEPSANCPCAKAYDKEARSKLDEIEAEKHEVKTMKIRLAAVEKVLWGLSFVGVLTSDRPKLINEGEVVDDAEPKKKKSKK